MRKTLKKKIKHTKTHKKTQKTQKNKEVTKMDILEYCQKKHCRKEMNKQKKDERINDRKLKTKQKCNYDSNLNAKFDNYNKVKVTKKIYPSLLFPFFKMDIEKTSPCLIEERKLLNDPYIPIGKCTDKFCKKEYKDFVGI